MRNPTRIRIICWRNTPNKWNSMFLQLKWEDDCLLLTIPSENNLNFCCAHFSSIVKENFPILDFIFKQHSFSFQESEFLNTESSSWVTCIVNTYSVNFKSYEFFCESLEWKNHMTNLFRLDYRPVILYLYLGIKWIVIEFKLTRKCLIIFSF